MLVIETRQLKQPPFIFQTLRATQYPLSICEIMNWGIFVLPLWGLGLNPLSVNRLLSEMPPTRV